VDACDMHYLAPESSLGGTSICGSNHVTLHGNVLDLCTALSRSSHCCIKLMGTSWIGFVHSTKQIEPLLYQTHGNVLDLCTALSRASHCFIKLMGTFWARWNADGSWEHLATCTCALPIVNLLHQTQDSCFPIYSILCVPESACRPRRYRNCL